MAPILTPPPGPDRDALTPQESRALKNRMDRVAEEKAEALKDPGPTWREWAFYEGFKWWFAIMFLIADSWVVVQWLYWGSYVGMGISLAVAFYVEFLVYRVLWTRPGPHRRRTAFRPTWYRPVEIGWWTPEADLARHGIAPPADPEAPQAEDFL